MILAKVLERVIASAKSDRLPDRQYLSVQPLEGFGNPTPLIAIDTVGSGPGDLVLVLQEGTGARQVALTAPYGDEKNPLPAQMVIVGVVDQVQLES